MDAERWAFASDDGNFAVFHDLPVGAMPDGGWRAYFLEYSTSTGTVVELLQSDPAYSEFTHVDVGAPGRRRYTRRDRGVAWEYRIMNLGSPGPWFIRPEIDDQIKAFDELFLESDQPWYLRVSSSDIFAFDQVAGLARRYSLPEYINQIFSPTAPYVFLGLQRCRVLGANYVQAPNGQLAFGGEQGDFEMLVMNEEGVPKAAYTSSVDGGQFFQEQIDGRQVLYRSRNIVEEGVSVHRRSGLIYLSDEILPTDRVYIKCTNKLEAVRYIGLNVNPIFNPSMRHGRAFLYCLEASEVGENNIALQHVVLDQFDDIVDWSDVTRLGELGQLDAAYVGDAVTSGLEKLLALQPTILQVASVTLNANGDPNDLALIDVRRPGGIIKPEIAGGMDPYLHQYPELQWAVEDGLANRSAPLHMAAHVRLPFSLTQEGGGVHTAESIQAKLQENVALGTHFVIDYEHEVPFDIRHLEYDIDTETATIHFDDLGGAYTYQVRHRNRGYAEQQIVDVATVPSTLSGSYIAITVSLSSEDTSHWLQIVPILGGVEWPATREARLVVGDSRAVVLPLQAIFEGAASFAMPLEAIWEAA